MTRVTDLIPTGAEIDEGNPVVGIGLTYNLGNGRTLTLQTMMPRDGDPKAMDKTLDVLVGRLERQVAKMIVPAIEEDIRKGRGILAAAEFDVLQFKNQFENRPLNTQAKQQMAQMERQVKLHRENIEHSEQQLEKAKKEAE